VKVLIDTNIILDVMLARKPFAQSAVSLLTKIVNGELIGYLGATTITTVHYLASKLIGSTQALVEINKLVKICEIAPINRSVIEESLKIDFCDFEDAILHEAAIFVGADAIVTRNTKDFKTARLKIFTPRQLLSLIDTVKSA